VQSYYRESTINYYAFGSKKVAESNPLKRPLPAAPVGEA
jgi:hypothetical protein